MKKPVKAALLSAMVFPGLGHFYLKRYAIGILLALGAVSAIYFLVSATVDKALEVVEKIEEGVPLDTKSIADLVSQPPDGNGPSVNIAAIALLALWVTGIVDSYLVGRAQQRAQDKAGKRAT